MTLGSVNLPVVCAGAHVVTGDVVIADDDGVVVVQRTDAAAVAQAALVREPREAVNRARLEQGDLGARPLGHAPGAEDKGLRSIDGPVD
jgi:4-hydroxy-4-methyl-2-oxoglutarate aldolase